MPKPPELTEKDKEIRHRMGQANVPPMYLTKTLPNLGKHGSELRQYLATEYSKDKKDKIGLWLHGSTLERVSALPVLSKELVLTGDGVYLLSLRALVNMYDDDENHVRRLERSKALCISYFQTDGGECPYTWAERSRVEHLVISRVEKGLRHYVSSCKRLQDADWWTQDFRLFMSEHMREFAFGK